MTGSVLEFAVEIEEEEEIARQRYKSRDAPSRAEGLALGRYRAYRDVRRSLLERFRSCEECGHPVDTIKDGIWKAPNDEQWWHPNCKEDNDE